MRAGLVTTLLLMLGCPERRDATRRTAGAVSPNPYAVDAGTMESRFAHRTVAFSERQEERDGLAQLLLQEGISDTAVLAAMRRVPRHAFVPEAWPGEAYRNRALSIGYGQTISQPLVVAAMTEAVHPKHTDKCLEIGTGSG